MPDNLDIWTIYHHNDKIPHFNCLARRFSVGHGGTITETDQTLLGTLECLRQTFEGRGLACMTRSPGDDPSVIESWF